MTNAVAIDKNGALATEPFLDREKQTLLADTILKGATANELALFVNLCSAKRLDPFTRQIYGIKTGQGLQMFASIDGLRVIAQRSGQYAGQVGPFWCGKDGQWTDVWLAPEPPAAAKVGVLRTGWHEPMWGVATLKSYGKDSPIWKKMADIMLAKCAESVALRKAFPDDISGLYIREEFGEAETPESAPRPATAPESRPESTSVKAEVVDAETREIQRPTMLELVKKDTARIADLLKLSAKDVQAYAKTIGANYRTVEGATALRDALEAMLEAQEDQDEDEEDYEAYEAQGTLLDAETAPIEREW